MATSAFGNNRHGCRRIRYFVWGLILIPVFRNLVLSRNVTRFDSFLIPRDEWIPVHYSNQTQQNPTLIIQLRGEMGNHLSAIAHGMCFQWYASQVYGIELQPKLRHQVVRFGKDRPDEDSPKWKPTRDIIQQCFPKLRTWNFDRGNHWKEYYDSERQQQQWLPPLTRKHLDYINGRSWQGVSTRVDRLPAELVDWNETLTTLEGLKDRPVPRARFFSYVRRGAIPDIVSVPFLQSESLENTLVVDRCLDELRELFEFDYDTCCGKELPDDDETVLHFRNFETELIGDDESGLKDISPSQTADVLLKHLERKDKVAITTRVFNEKLQRHVDALRAKGLQVRIIQGQSGPQDFCFLLKSKKELVGNYQSTFFFWAALLGRASNVRLYTSDSPQLRQRYLNSTSVLKRRFLHNWSHPDLRNRLHQLLITVDEKEEVRGAGD